MFNKTLQLDNEHLLSRQLKGLYHYNHGQLQEAVSEFQVCWWDDDTDGGDGGNNDVDGDDDDETIVSIFCRHVPSYSRCLIWGSR